MNPKRTFTKLLKSFFLYGGIYKSIRTLFPNNRISILRYHAVVKPEENFYTTPTISIDPVQFEKHVKYFVRNYTVVSLDQAISFIKLRKRIPKNCIVFTFDDGYADNFEAARILKKYGVSGTFFVTVEPILRESLFWLGEVTLLILKTEEKELKIFEISGGEKLTITNMDSRWEIIRRIVRTIKSNNLNVREKIRKEIRNQLADNSLLKDIENLMLNVHQVKEMIEMGMIIGSHTMTHLNLPNADSKDAVHEITFSKKKLETVLGEPIKHFSYPNSGPYKYFDETIRGYVERAGYESSCTSRNGFVSYDSDLLALKRIRTVPALEEVIHEIEWDRIFGR